jgi:HK97 family phage major capsid protein
MKDWKQLLQAADAKATAALEIESVDEREKLNTEAEALIQEAETIKASLAIQAKLKATTLPAALPTDGEPGNADGGQQDAQDAAIKAFHQMRFGDQDSAVEAILKDLHGEDYWAKRYQQLKSFNRWLRVPADQSIPREGKTFLWTPNTVKQAIEEGQDVEAMKTTMVEAQDVLGGYLVPEDWRANVIERMMGFTVVRQRATVIQTTREAFEMPVATGGDSQYPNAVRVTMVDETPSAGTAATNATWGQKRVPIHTAMAETFLSRNLVEDAAFNLPAYLARAFAQSAAIVEDNQFLTGSGSGEPQGLLPGSANALSLTVANSGVADALDNYDAIIDLVYAIDSQYRQANTCAFVMEKATTRTIAKLQDGAGRYLWDRTERMAGKLEGYTHLEQEAMPTIASDAYVALFGDFSGYWIGDRIGMSVERFLDSATARINQVCYVMRRRYGGQCCETWRFGVMRIHT